MKKILFSDMDGTIIDGFDVRHEKDCAMLHELHKHGHYIAFDTGRNEQEAHFCTDRHQFPYDYLVLNNGAHIVDDKGNEIFKKVIPADIGRKIIEYCLAIPDVLLYFYDGKETIGYCNGKTMQHTEDGHKESKNLDFKKEYLKAKEFDIIAVNQVNEEIDQMLIVQKYIQDNFGEYALGTLNTHYLDITAAGCSKGSGITTLKNLLEEEVETYAIGDSYNDISMFEAADHAYTFTHVTDEIKQHADKEVSYVYQVIEDMLK